MGRTSTYLAIPLVVVAAGGAIQFLRPVPPVQVQAAPGPLKLPGAFSVAFPATGQAALGAESLGLVAETPNEQPVAIASLTKMMTAYLLLQAQPLPTGEDGPVTTITNADVQVYQNDKAAGDSVVRVSAGEKLTERQLLEGLLLPSGDNIATLIARQVAGTQANFVKKMNDAASALKMTQTTYTDVSGVSPATVSTAHDQVLMAQAAMQDRAFREIVRLPQADLPVAGRVFNVDFMVGKQGITGIKTGSTLAAGSCFVGSFPITVGTSTEILLGAVLGQPSLQVALTTDTQILHAVAPQFRTYAIAPPADGLARLTTAWGQDSTLAPASPLQVLGYPGMPIDLAVKLTATKLPIEPGQGVASLTLTTGTLSQTAPLQAAQAIRKPGPLWRLFR